MYLEPSFQTLKKEIPWLRVVTDHCVHPLPSSRTPYVHLLNLTSISRHSDWLEKFGNYLSLFDFDINLLMGLSQRLRGGEIL
jgi:hypothetical protein